MYQFSLNVTFTMNSIFVFHCTLMGLFILCMHIIIIFNLFSFRTVLQKQIFWVMCYQIFRLGDVFHPDFIICCELNSLLKCIGTSKVIFTFWKNFIFVLLRGRSCSLHKLLISPLFKLFIHLSSWKWVFKIESGSDKYY